MRYCSVIPWYRPFHCIEPIVLDIGFYRRRSSQVGRQNRYFQALNPRPLTQGPDCPHGEVILQLDRHFHHLKAVLLFEYLMDPFVLVILQLGQATSHLHNPCLFE